MTLFESFAKLSQFIEFRLYSSKLSRLHSHTKKSTKNHMHSCPFKSISTEHKHTLLVVGGFLRFQMGLFKAEEDEAILSYLF